MTRDLRRGCHLSLVFMAVTALSLTTALPAHAAAPMATVHRATQDGPGMEVGTVRFRDSAHGLLVIPDLHDLTPGPHATHVHQTPDCGPMKKAGKATPAGAAGGHYDPKGTGRHAGPYGDGHLGDLPNLIVEQDGTATIPVLAPRLHAEDVRGHALMLHAGADRYAEHARHAHGTGGARMYCGVIR